MDTEDKRTREETQLDRLTRVAFVTQQQNDRIAKAREVIAKYPGVHELINLLDEL